MNNDLMAISRAVEKGDDVQVVKLIGEMLDAGVSAMDILGKGLIPGVQALGKLFKEGQVYLPEILISTRAMNQGVEKIKPHLADVDIYNKGTVVLGTVEGDLHDIGKNLVKLMLESNGFKVVDLGIDVSSGSFLKAIKDNRADIIAMSALLTITMAYMQEVMKALDRADMRNNVKVLIGGAPITSEFAHSIGADAFAEDCASAVDEAMRLMTF